MKKLATVASDFRLGTLLSCSAAVLLTACGGSADPGTDQAQTAASVESTVTASVTASNAPNAADAGDASGAVANPNEFVVKGYEGDAQPRLLASVTSVDAASAITGADATALVTQLYRTLLNRDPEQAGLAHWTQALANGMTAGQLEASIRGSNEYARLHPAGGNTMSTPATAYNYYVSPTGSDTAAGTKAAPFKTLARAAKAATKAGTTVWVAPGTYAGGIKTTANGTASARIYWVSTTKWGAKVVPPSSSTMDSAWDNRGNYVSIVGFDIDGSNGGSGKAWTHGIYTGGSYGMIADNHIHHLATKVACTSAGGSAIGVDSYYHGVMTDVVSNVVNDIGPAGCTYVQGIYFSTSGSIKNNLVYRVGAVAIHLWHDANNVIITNNTAAASNFGMVIGGGDFYYTTAGANNVFVANNIVYDNKYGISEQGTTGKANQYKNNLVVKNTSYNFSLRNGLTHTGTVSSDPLFAGYSRTAATPNFHLSSSSPAIGRGIVTNAYPTDLDGKARNASTGYDIGAYQH
ncbi:choice-of-anchor Q domain-containing protein [Massilia sp. TN1-12]|uniref:choice-of-anchor Q domain-containing protein n=1 Tax=Massilia paldalensis TaxID=3377675 RepID=UPI00384A8987